MSEENNRNEEDQEIESKEEKMTPEEDLEDEEDDEEEDGGGFKSKGLVILGLIVFVGLLFAVQKYIHFGGGDDKAKKQIEHTHVDTTKKSIPSSGSPRIPSVQPNVAPNANVKAIHQDLHTKDIPHTHSEVDSSKSDSNVTVPKSAPVDSVHGMPVKDDQDIKEVVRKYIEENPEVVAKALQNLNQKMSKDRESKSKNFIKDNIQDITTGRPYLGNPKGSVTIVEFFDYKCSYCRRSHIVLERVLKDYPEVKLVLQPVPVLGKNSAEAVRAALAVWKLSPSHFDKFHEDLINSATIDDDSILAIARKHGISTDALIKEMGSENIQKLVNDNLEIAQNVGMRGVPTFIVKGELVPGSLSYEGFKDLLDSPVSQKAKMVK